MALTVLESVEWSDKLRGAVEKDPTPPVTVKVLREVRESAGQLARSCGQLASELDSVGLVDVARLAARTSEDVAAAAKTLRDLVRGRADDDETDVLDATVVARQLRGSLEVIREDVVPPAVEVCENGSAAEVQELQKVVLTLIKRLSVQVQSENERANAAVRTTASRHVPEGEQERPAGMPRGLRLNSQ